MRNLLVVATLLLATCASLAGCTQGDPGRDGKDFTGTCPAWIKGLSTAVFQEGFMNTSMPDEKFDPSHPTGAGLAQFQHRPLDLVDLDFHPTRNGQPQALGVANGTLTLSVFRSDGNGGISDALQLHDVADGPDGPRKDEWSWGPGVYKNFTLQVSLAEPDQEPNTAPIVLKWDFLPDADARSPSEAVMIYTAYFWYRTCSQDNTQTTV